MVKSEMPDGVHTTIEDFDPYYYPQEDTWEDMPATTLSGKINAFGFPASRHATDSYYISQLNQNHQAKEIPGLYTMQEQQNIFPVQTSSDEKEIDTERRLDHLKAVIREQHDHPNKGTKRSTVKQQLIEPDTETQDLLAGSSPGRPTMTQQQLRALSRRHLLVIIRDLEKELEQEKKEKESLLLAFKAGLEQGRQA